MSWPARAGLPHPPDGLAQEVGGPPHGVGASLAQAGHEHVARAGRHREEGVIAAHTGVAVVAGTLLLQAVRLADGGVEIDGEGRGARPGAGSPGAGEEQPADLVELAHVAPAEAAQERAEGGRRLHPEAQDAARAARPEGVRVVDRVATRQRRDDERQELVADMRPSGCGPEIEVGLDEVLQPEVVGQGGRQQEPCVGHQTLVVEGGVEAVQAVR